MKWISALLLAAAAAAAQGQQPSEPLPHAKWIADGLIDAGGSHEPYLFTVRRGGEGPDARKFYERAQSEETIRRLKEAGVEVFHTHLYKGFGMKAEMPEMEDARRAAAIAHRYGMKVDSYIQWNTMMYETFFAEEPRAQEWIQRDILGQPILLTYGFQQSWRYRPCFANQEYLNYLKKIVRYAVEEVKTDFIHFDNFDLNPEPESCHDKTCVSGFREFLKAKYTPEKRRERFGFENVDYVNPPQWNRDNRPENLQTIFDPGIQEWIDYRCQVMADALRQMASYAKSLNPEVAIEINPHGITGENRAWVNAIDHRRLLTSTEVFWTEEENEPALLPDGRLVSKIRSYKLARAFNNILLAYIADSTLAMSECLAFNQTIGFAGEEPLGADMKRYIKFYRDNREYFNQSREAAGVAVLRSYPSITYNHARTQLEAVLAEQALIQAHIPFELIFDGQMQDLSRFKVLVLPDSECLTDAQAAAVRRFVEGGGGLVATGQSGVYDEWRRPRAQSALAGLVDGQRRQRGGYQERVSFSQESGAPVRKEAGAGRTVYIPSMRFDGPMPQRSPYFPIDNRYWKRPSNWKELADAVGWAAKEQLPVEVTGPEFLVANVVSQPGKNRMMVHLVNYGFRRTPSIAGVQVKCRLPEERAIKAVKILSPDAPPAALTSSGGGFKIPEVKTYAIAVVSW